MIVASFYTAKYEQEVKNLIDTCHMHDLDYSINELPDKGSWLANVWQKPNYILDTLNSTTESVLWVDADATIQDHLTLLPDPEADMMGVANWQRYHGYYTYRPDLWGLGRRPGGVKPLFIRGGTLYFANNDNSRKMLDLWAGEAEGCILNGTASDPAITWAVRESGINFQELPLSYCAIFDTDADTLAKAGQTPVISHWQASRRFR